eukprot:15444468-Alexandrium_andersonii.AAC.1
MPAPSSHSGRMSPTRRRPRARCALQLDRAIQRTGPRDQGSNRTRSLRMGEGEACGVGAIPG